MREVVLCSAGGYARVVLPLLELLGFTLSYILDDEASGRTPPISGVPVRGSLSMLPDRKGISGFLAIADNQKRERAAERFKNIDWVTLIHPASWVDPSAKLGVGTYVAAGAVVNAKAVLGDHVIVGTGASVGHDSIVEDFVHLQSGVRLGGGACLGRGALCGIGSSVAPNCEIGAWATLGPRAVVVRHVPAGKTHVGVPARSL